MYIEFDVKGVKASVSSDIGRRWEPVTLTPQETAAVEFVKQAIAEVAPDETDLCCQRRATAYLSIVTREHYDFIRIKTGVRSNWFSVWIVGQDRQRYADDPRFSNQRNKRQLHWKVQLDAIASMADSKDLIQAAYLSAVHAWTCEQQVNNGSI